MFNKLTLSAAAAALCLSLGGCATGPYGYYGEPHGYYGEPHGTEVGTVGGAVAGGAIGAAVSRGNPVAMVGGAVVGGLVGNAAGQEYDYRHGRYDNQYYY